MKQNILSAISPSYLWVTILSLSIAVSAMGFSIIGYSQSTASMLVIEAQKQTAYNKSLMTEIEHNTTQIGKLTQDFVKHNKFTIKPIFLDDAYQAGISNSYLYSIKGDVPKEITEYYSSLEKLDSNLTSLGINSNSSKTLNKEVLEGMLTTSINLKKVLENVEYDDTAIQQSLSYIEVTKGGVGLTKLGVGLTVIAGIAILAPLLSLGATILNRSKNSQTALKKKS